MIPLLEILTGGLLLRAPPRSRSEASGGNRTFSVNATAIFHAVADDPLVNI